MKDEYDFSGAQRGKFSRPDALLRLPIYLDEEILRYLQQRADAKGVTLGN
jgi:hypothetical protein